MPSATSNKLELSIETGRINCYGTRFLVVQLEEGGDYIAVSKSGKYDLLPFDRNLLNKLGEAFAANFSKLDGILCYTECHQLDRWEGKKYIFGAHPNYKGKPWFDWALLTILFASILPSEGDSSSWSPHDQPQNATPFAPFHFKIGSNQHLLSGLSHCCTNSNQYQQYICQATSTSPSIDREKKEFALLL
jgi:hypothetical protein